MFSELTELLIFLSSRFLI